MSLLPKQLKGLATFTKRLHRKCTSVQSITKSNFLSTCKVSCDIETWHKLSANTCVIFCKICFYNDFARYWHMNVSFFNGVYQIVFSFFTFSIFIICSLGFFIGIFGILLGFFIAIFFPLTASQTALNFIYHGLFPFIAFFILLIMVLFHFSIFS